jgi:hypothetical protein
MLTTLALLLQIPGIREADSARIDYEAVVCHSPAYGYPVRLKGRLLFQGERFRAEFTQSDPDGGGPVAKTLVCDGRKLKVVVDGRTLSELDAPPRFVERLKALFTKLGAGYPLAELALNRPRCFLLRLDCPPGCPDHPERMMSRMRLRVNVGEAPAKASCALPEEGRRPGRGAAAFDAEETWTPPEIAPKIPDGAFSLPP